MISNLIFLMLGIGLGGAIVCAYSTLVLDKEELWSEEEDEADLE